MRHISDKLKESASSKIISISIWVQAMEFSITVVSKVIKLVTRINMVCLVVMDRWVVDTTEDICRINITSMQATQTRFIKVTLRIHRECLINNNKDIWVATKVQVPSSQWAMEAIISHLTLCINKVFPKHQLLLQ